MARVAPGLRAEPLHFLSVVSVAKGNRAKMTFACRKRLLKRVCGKEVLCFAKTSLVLLATPKTLSYRYITEIILKTGV